MKKKLLRFIVIDDDPIYMHLCSYFIRKVAKDAELLCFDRATPALDHIRTVENDLYRDTHGIIMLNINMPGMSGWDFVEAYTALSPATRKRLTLYVVSASVAQTDRQQALSHPCVADYLVKPLSPADIKKMMHKADS